MSKSAPEIAYEEAVTKVQNAYDAYVKEQNDMKPVHANYLDLVRIYDGRKTLYCAGGSAGRSYTVSGNDLDLTCSHSAANLQKGQENTDKLYASILAAQSRVNQFYASIENLKKRYEDSKVEEDLAYRTWIEWKKANMSAQELSEYASVGVNTESQASRVRNKTFGIIAVVVVVMVIAGFLIYRKYAK